MSGSALRFLADRPRRHCRVINSRRRRPAAEPFPPLAHLRAGHTYARLAAGFGVGFTTAYRCGAEAAEPLAVPAPTSADAVRTAPEKAFVVLDGALLPIDRIAADRPLRSGKHKRHGMNVQVLPDPFGRLLAGLAGRGRGRPRHSSGPRTRHRRRPDRTQVTCRADKGHRGADGTVPIPHRGRRETPSPGQKAVNRSHAKIRALVEQTMTTLKNCRPPRKPRGFTTRITALAQAVPALHPAGSDR